MKKQNNQSTLRRRVFLGGASTVIALPFLEALAPRIARGQDASAPKRFMGYFVPNGFDMADFRPVGTGTDFIFGPMMQSLEVHREKMLVVSGLQNEKQDQSAGDHSGGIGSFLTARTVYVEQSMGGPSLDQVLATSLGQETKLKSLELSGEEGFQEGFCDSGYPCAVGNHISFDENGIPLPKLDNLEVIFQRLFQGYDEQASLEEQKRRQGLRKSVLDVVLEQANGLSPRLSSRDRTKLDEYFTSIRDVERRIDLVGQAGASCMPPVIPAEPLSIEGKIQLLHELIAMAFQCDMTRVLSFMWGNMTSLRNYAFLGAPGGHHDISHHGGNANNLEALKKIGKWEIDRFSELLTRLDSMIDFDGRSVLDNTTIFYSSDISDGDAHNHDDMPVVIAGGGAGFTMGRHIQTEGEPFFGNLYVSIAQAYGLDLQTFGERGNGPLIGLV